jgi:hypothetical protein
MAPTVYSIRRFGPLWSWRITQGAAAPAEGWALSEGGARRAARTRVRNALHRLGKVEEASLPGPPAVESTAQGPAPSDR